MKTKRTLAATSTITDWLSKHRQSRKRIIFHLVALSVLLFVWMAHVFYVPTPLVDTTQRMTRFGSQDGIWYCDASQLNEDSIVYSFGLGMDTSFDEELIQTFPGLRIWGFDPTPKAVQYVRERMDSGHLQSRYFTFVQEALTGDPNIDSLSFVVPYRPKVSMHSGTGLKQLRTTVSYPAATIQAYMQRFGHERLDILKIDVEGSEYQVLEHMIQHDFFPTRQLLIEFHLRFYWSNPFMKIKHKGILKALHEKGYRMARSDHLQREMTFVRVE